MREVRTRTFQHFGDHEAAVGNETSINGGVVGVFGQHHRIGCPRCGVRIRVGRRILGVGSLSRERQSTWGVFVERHHIPISIRGTQMREGIKPLCIRVCTDGDLVAEVVNTLQLDGNISGRRFTRVLHAVAVNIPPRVVADRGFNSVFSAGNRPNNKLEPIGTSKHTVDVGIAARIIHAHHRQLNLNHLTGVVGARALHAQGRHLTRRGRAGTTATNSRATFSLITPCGGAVRLVGGITRIQLNRRGVGVQDTNLLARLIPVFHLSRIESERAVEAGACDVVLWQDVDNIRVAHQACLRWWQSVVQLDAPLIAFVGGLTRAIDLHHRGEGFFLQFDARDVADLHLCVIGTYSRWGGIILGPDLHHIVVHT